jgi:hypothetical protein
MSEVPLWVSAKPRFAVRWRSEFMAAMSITRAPSHSVEYERFVDPIIWGVA